MGEWKRIFNWKMLIIITSAVLLNICLFTYGQMSGRSTSDIIFAKNENKHLVERYHNMDLNQAIDRITKENSAIRNYIKSQTSEDSATLDITNKYADDVGCQEMILYYQKLSDSEKVQMDLELKEIRTKLVYLNEYPGNVKQVITNAANLKRFSLFSKPDSFSYNNILRTAKDFERVQNLKLSLVNDKAVDSFLNYYYINYIAFALMIIVIYGLFSERENGVWSIVHSSSNGRTRLALKRFFLILTSSLGITGVLYVCTFINSLLLHGGWSDLESPIQTISKYYKFTYLMSKRHYLVNNFVVSWFAIFVVSTVIWMLFVMFRNRNHTLIFTGIFIGTEVLLFNKIQVQSVYNALRYVNVVNLFRMNETYGSYNNWGWNTHVYSVFMITMIVLILLLILSGILAIIKSTIMRPETRQTWIAKLFAFFNQQYQKIFTHFSVTLKEIHKLILTGKAVWVIVAVLGITIYFAGTGKMRFTDAQLELDKMYLEHGGNDYTYIVDYVEQQNQLFSEAKQKLAEVVQKYENGEVDLKTYSNAVTNLQFSSDGVKALKELSNKIEYLHKVNEDYGVAGYMISDRGYEQIFGKYSSQREFILILALIVGIMLIITECISMEYRTGMQYIVQSCEKGRSWIFKRKVLACVVFTILIFTAVYGIDFWNMYHIYGMPYLNAPLMSLTFRVGSRFHISIFEWIMIRLVLRLMVCFATMSIAIITSKIIGKKGNRALMPLVLVCIIGVLIVIHGIGGIL